MGLIGLFSVEPEMNELIETLGEGGGGSLLVFQSGLDQHQRGCLNRYLDLI
jgi:hypothetical protein